MDARRYPVMLDASITGNRAKEIFTLMREGGYINSLTRKIEVKYMTFNADEMTFSMNHLVRCQEMIVCGAPSWEQASGPCHPRWTRFIAS